MTYLGPEISALDLTYLHDRFTPLQNNKLLEPTPGTLWDYIVQHSEKLSLYKCLVVKAQMQNIFDDIQLEKTYLLCEDTDLLKSFSTSDILKSNKNTAMKIIQYNSFNRKINSRDIASSSSLRLNTSLRGHFIESHVGKEITFLGEKNNVSVVKKPDIILNNANVCLCTSLLIPEIF